ncbi:DNA-binding protein [Lactococcus allomyrinae]|uniref:DNA-binding protein n=1 Tax=Lactococcus allomyrinae TaxID=2419773 RepID=A0A387BPD7_9LACT|nr:DNA-binding protein [Lactococcus allomyrinae]AYG00391.1 DNA-binding protein [Lactococcus allomyrinae]
MKFKHVPIDSNAVWTSKKGILLRYENLNVYTLNRWLSEMLNNKRFRAGVINPTNKLVFINIEIFEDFLYWKQHDYSKIKEK